MLFFKPRGKQTLSGVVFWLAEIMLMANHESGNSNERNKTSKDND